MKKQIQSKAHKALKQNKGITLIALIITIVVLLILAVVAINAIQNDGILSHAGNVANTYNQSVKNEEETLQNYLDYLENLNGGGSGNGDDPVEYEKVADAKTSGKTYTSNTFLQDDNGNLVKVPAGFKIASDSATVVTGGVVIEDATYENTIGSQFVWIPTGNIKTSPTDTTGTNITLARYTFNVTINMDTGAISETSTGAEYARYLSATDALEDPMYTAAGMDADFVEGEIEGVDKSKAKGYALSITNFLNSAKPITEGGNGGYYIGRYEARTNSTTGRASKNDTLTGMTTVKTNAVYNYVTQPQATERSQSMYAGNSNFTSDLVNSFAWDTAIAFIQAFGDNDYSKQTSLNDSLATTGTNNLTDTTKQDKVCNIWDMASNCFEWSTETSSTAVTPCVHRGGYCYYSYLYTGYRDRHSTTDSFDGASFRPLLYVGL